MIPYTPHPILFEIGPIAIRYYSLAYILGFALVYFAVKRQYGKDHAENVASLGLLGAIIGGRIGEFVFFSPQTFVTDPMQILRIWEGGMSFHGGLIGVALVMWYYTRKHKLSIAQFADIMILPVTLALAFGRIANFLNGELVGTVTTVPWCMEFPGYDGCRHPSQLYEALYSFIIAGVLYWQLRKAKLQQYQAGFVFTLFIILYGVFRFIFNFFRDDQRWLGISMGQYLSLAMVIIGVYVLVTKYKKTLKKMFQ